MSDDNKFYPPYTPAALGERKKFLNKVKDTIEAILNFQLGTAVMDWREGLDKDTFEIITKIPKTQTTISISVVIHKDEDKPDGE